VLELGLPFEEDQDILSQGSRCAKVSAARQSELLSDSNPVEKLSVVEAVSTLGRRWLSVIPFSPNLALTNAEVATGLHFRTLCPGREDLCFHCAASNSFGHDDICSGRALWTPAQHGQVKRVLASSLPGSQDLNVVQHTRHRIDPVNVDNQGAIETTKNGTHSEKTKHIDVAYKYGRKAK